MVTRIRMLTLAAGPWGSVQPGTELDLSQAQAEALIEGGYAVAIDAPPEAATAALVETATEGPTEVRGGDQPGASDGQPAPSNAGATEPDAG
jgi:hypothetical protein